MDYRRVYRPGGCYFFTVVTHKRRPILIDNIDLLRESFWHVCRRYPMEIDAIVVLPDHLHTIWRLPEGDADYSRRWMLLKRKFSTALPACAANRSQVNKREKGVWQRRFWEHLIRDDEDWRRHMDYIHYNPVKHGYVDAADKWAASSFARLVKAGWYESGWGSVEPVTVRGMELE